MPATLLKDGDGVASAGLDHGRSRRWKWISKTILGLVGVLFVLFILAVPTFKSYTSITLWFRDSYGSKEPALALGSANRSGNQASLKLPVASSNGSFSISNPASEGDFPTWLDFEDREEEDFISNSSISGNLDDNEFGQDYAGRDLNARYDPNRYNETWWQNACDNFQLFG